MASDASSPGQVDGFPNTLRVSGCEASPSAGAHEIRRRSRRRLPLVDEAEDHVADTVIDGGQTTGLRRRELTRDAAVAMAVRLSDGDRVERGLFGKLVDGERGLGTGREVSAVHGAQVLWLVALLPGRQRRRMAA